MGAKSKRDEEGLTPKQREYIQDVIKYPYRRQGEHAEAVGILTSTVSKWKKIDPQFREAMRTRLDEMWEDARAAAQETMITLAESQDFQASKYILDSCGMNGKQKVEVSGGSGFTINITSNNSEN